MKPMLVARTQGTTGLPAVFALTLNSMTQIGNSLTAADSEDATSITSLYPFAQNRVLFYKGRLYWLQRDRIRRYNPSTGDWDSIHTLPAHNTLSYAASHTGLYAFNRKGNQCIGLAYFNTDAVQDLLISWSEDGDNWKSTLLANPNMVDAITSVYGGRELFVNNKLFWGQNVADEFYYIDFDHMTCGVFTEPFSVTSAFYGAPVYYNGKIIVPGSNTSTSNMWVLLGGSAYSFHSHSAVTTGFSTDCHWAHFTEGPFIYVLQWINNALRVMQLRINLSEGSGYFSPVIMENNDITSTVKPDAWTLANSSFRIIYDPFTAPGQRANIYIGFHQGEAEGQAIDWYQWMGPGTEMVGVGSSGETYLALPYNNQFGGGERFWEPGNIGVNIEKTGLGSGRGRCKIWYRVTESTTIPSGTMAQVGFLGKPVGFNSNPPASGFISLVNTSVGSISADGKLINNVPIGSGELRTVEWDGSSDGVPSRAPAFIIPYASGILT